MESLHEPSLRVLERLDATFDPYRTPDAFVPFLATWLDLERLFEPRFGGSSSESDSPIATGRGRLRELTAAAAYLSKWRGTTKGLLRFLETATGESGFAVVEGVPDWEGRPRPFHVRVLAPESVRPYRGLIERIIDQEKPAYVTYELSIGAEDDGAPSRSKENPETFDPPTVVEKTRRSPRPRGRSKPPRSRKTSRPARRPKALSNLRDRFA